MCHASRLCLLLQLFWCVEPLCAADAAAGSVAGVLLLRNGEVLAGTATKVGDRYVVSQSDGNELRIPTRDVEMHCLDLDEAYVRKRGRIGERNASGHLDLADWCLRYSLHARAADELLAAMALAPHDPRIRGLERRLQSAVILGQGRENLPTKPSPPRQLEAPAVPLRLPNEAVEGFASRIQPILLNRCGATGCHGARTASAFQLLGPVLGKTITQRYTQRNLAAVLRQLDLAHPDTSPLLTVPTKPHASLQTPVFGKHDQPQLELLSGWVRAASRAAPRTASAPSPSSQLVQTSLRQPIPLPPANEASGQAQTLPVTAAPADGAPCELPVPLDFRDPFDPERFNRQFLEPTAPHETPPLASGQGSPGCSTTAAAASSAPRP